VLNACRKVGGLFLSYFFFLLKKLKFHLVLIKN
jgi:hypothetical protein